jgi:hypothetical protein
MIPKMIRSRMVVKTRMAAVQVAALIGDSSARIAREVPGMCWHFSSKCVGDFIGTGSWSLS